MKKMKKHRIHLFFAVAVMAFIQGCGYKFYPGEQGINTGKNCKVEVLYDQGLPKDSIMNGRAIYSQSSSDIDHEDLERAKKDACKVGATNLLINKKFIDYAYSFDIIFFSKK